jgi:hypothetical protein
MSLINSDSESREPRAGRTGEAIGLDFGGALASAPVLLAPRAAGQDIGRKPGPLVERKFRRFGAETGGVRR